LLSGLVCGAVLGLGGWQFWPPRAGDNLRPNPRLQPTRWRAPLSRKALGRNPKPDEPTVPTPEFAEARPSIDIWMMQHTGELGEIARHWFGVMRTCGDDVREVLHDGHPTACVADAAFAYVNAFKAHVNVGFFRGAEIADPEGLLEGTGKFMRHVKLSPARDLNATALSKLIAMAYADMKSRVRAELLQARPRPPNE
jgi:hypothetical protein